MLIVSIVGSKQKGRKDFKIIFILKLDLARPLDVRTGKWNEHWKGVLHENNILLLNWIQGCMPWKSAVKVIAAI